MYDFRGEELSNYNQGTTPPHCYLERSVLSAYRVSVYSMCCCFRRNNNELVRMF